MKKLIKSIKNCWFQNINDYFFLKKWSALYEFLKENKKCVTRDDYKTIKKIGKGGNAVITLVKILKQDCYTPLKQITIIKIIKKNLMLRVNFAF